MKIKKLDNREKAYIATFGTLWGASEITLGFVLHNFHIPFTGLLLTFIGCIISLTCAKLIDRRRAIIYTAMIAAILKMLSITTIKLGPFLAIIASALVAQAVVLIMNLNIASYITAGGLMCCWPFIHVLITQFVIWTPEIFKIYQDFINNIGFKGLKVSTIICLILLIHFIIGSIGGLVAWNISKELLKESDYNEHTAKT